MVNTALQPSKNPLRKYIESLENGLALLKDTESNLREVVGILKSYGVVLDRYSVNLNYIAEHQFLVLFPFFKYFNGKFSVSQLFRHWWHDRINFEYAEYCMRCMLWHGGGGLDTYLDTPEFEAITKKAIQAKLTNNWLMLALNKVFPEFLPEQVKMFAYYTALGQFWRVMSDMFLSLSDLYDQGKIKSIPDVVKHILDNLVVSANKPITYQVKIKDEIYDLIPESAGLTFLTDTAVPYVEAIFFRGTPFFGTVSYNAQAYQISYDQAMFTYGALYADPLPTGGAGIPPTLLMQDMRHFLPDYLQQFYRQNLRGEDDLLVKICISFQKSMYCVTTAAIKGLAPYPLDTKDLEEKKANRLYLENWLNRFLNSRIDEVNK
jgi:CO2 hydration protein